MGIRNGRSKLNPLTLGLLVAAASGVLLSQGAWAQTESQTFDTEASAIAGGWGENGVANSFGFQSSNNTGQTPAGEAGGTFPRTNVKTSYGDITLGGSLTQSNIITGAGELSIRNAGNADGEHLIGHYNAASVTANQKTNFIGILILRGIHSGAEQDRFPLYDGAVRCRRAGISIIPQPDLRSLPGRKPGPDPLQV